MRALITGVTGFVGSHLARTLLDQDYEVYGYARRRADGAPPKRMKEQGIYGDVKIIYGDLFDLTSVLMALHKSQPDVIFHLGAQSHVGRSFDAPLETFQANCMGTQNILEGVRLKGMDPKIVFAGSSEEYGLQVAHEVHKKLILEDHRYVFPLPEGDDPEIPIKETNHLRPMSPYAASKVYGDTLMRTYHTVYGLKTIVSRAFNHEGAGRGDNFVTSIIARQAVCLKLGLQKQIDIGNVNAFRDWSHVQDIVDGYILLSKLGNSGDVYNQGSMRTNSVLTYIMLALQEQGYELGRITTGTGLYYDGMSEWNNDDIYGIKWDKTYADKLMIGGRLQFSPVDKGLTITTDKGPVKINIDPSRYRPSDVPVLLSDTTKIKNLGFTTNYSLKNIVNEQMNYYLDPANR